MSDAYTPGINNGDVMSLTELTRIANASAALESRIATLEARPPAAYGSMRMSVGESHTIDLSPTPAKIADWDTENNSSGIITDLAAGSLEVEAVGVYDYTVSVYLTGINASNTYDLIVYLNGVEAGAMPSGDIVKGTTDMVITGIGSPRSHAVGDKITVYLTSSGTETVTIARAMQKMFRVG